MIHRLLRMEHAELKENAATVEKEDQKTTMDDDDVDWLMNLPPFALRWKRLILLLRMIHMHALTGAMISYMEDMREFKAKRALESYHKLAGSTLPPAAAVKKPYDKNAPKPMAKGKALARSKTSTWRLEPEDCIHRPEQMSQPRGGRGGAMWVTCLDCGSRWERVWESLPASSNNPLPSLNPTAADAAQDRSDAIWETFQLVDTEQSKLEGIYQTLVSEKMTPMAAMGKIMEKVKTESEVEIAKQMCQNLLTQIKVGNIA